jgi:hypothetical protein
MFARPVVILRWRVVFQSWLTATLLSESRVPSTHQHKLLIPPHRPISPWLELRSISSFSPSPTGSTKRWRQDCERWFERTSKGKLWCTDWRQFSVFGNFIITLFSCICVREQLRAHCWTVVERMTVDQKFAGTVAVACLRCEIWFSSPSSLWLICVTS